MPITLSTNRTVSSAAVEDGFLSCGEFSPAGDESWSIADYLQRMRGYGARQHFARNEVIFNQADAADQVYKIVSGMVRLCRYMPDGRRAVVNFLLPGELMGCSEAANHLVSAEAVTEVMLIAYPRACFDRLMKENGAAREQLLRHLSDTLLTAHQHMMVLGCQKAKERLASFLIRLADRQDLSCGDRLELPMSRQDIADHLGLTIETISRMVTVLRSEGLLLVPNTHQLELRDLAALRALAAEG